ncbi:MAG: 6-carboxytetrahydropterin synthase [candidate division WOR-3 bacterium]|nr:6-carboxytetrahydropterin synthase [candidate division WOR-3 bacterium]MCX7837224.1 6-carboxytetrahydropterin synthase [candidate division WOR-3 bacterium]MDW8114377.1 6-carboxytetrahydropterin synthase [candidate division WOR-3 bacterium]
MSFYIIIRSNFSAAHRLKELMNDEEIHGHNYLVEVFIKEEKVDKKGYQFDFREVEKFLKSILPEHKFLNEFFDFAPTCENIAKYLFYKIKEKYPIVKIRLWENEKYACEYEEKNS